MCRISLIVAYRQMLTDCQIPSICMTLRDLADSRLKRTTGLEPATFGLGSRSGVSGARSYGRFGGSTCP